MTSVAPVGDTVARRPGLVVPRLAVSQLRLGRNVPIAMFVAVTIAAVAVPVLAPHDPLLPVGQAFQEPGSAGAPFGTDQVGRDMLSRMLYGFRSTWLWALVIVGVGVTVGGFLGSVAGAVGGRTDRWIMRLADATLAIPSQMLAISIVAVIGRSLAHTVFSLSLVWWAYFARIMRAEVRALAARPHIEAAKLAGVGPFRLLRRHLVPGTAPAMVIAISHDLGNALVLLGTLSFVGLGARPPAPELGGMAAQGVSFLLTSWWVPLLPGLALFALALLLNIAGDVLRAQMSDR